MIMQKIEVGQFGCCLFILTPQTERYLNVKIFQLNILTWSPRGSVDMTMNQPVFYFDMLLPFFPYFFILNK